MHSSKFEKNGSCDLLICDEAHRLKNDQTLTNRVCDAFTLKCLILRYLGNFKCLLSLMSFDDYLSLPPPPLLGT